ncbi:hypothetical protein ACRAWD_02730 [Caulobacter segnis]
MKYQSFRPRQDRHWRQRQYDPVRGRRDERGGADAARRPRSATTPTRR